MICEGDVILRDGAQLPSAVTVEAIRMKTVYWQKLAKLQLLDNAEPTRCRFRVKLGPLDHQGKYTIQASSIDYVASAFANSDGALEVLIKNTSNVLTFSVKGAGK